MKLSLPLAVVLALLSNLVPGFGRIEVPSQARPDTPLPPAQR